MAKNTVLDSASFSLVRTDARLTGNIKLTVDSSGYLWLNSIDGNDFLSNDKYKHRAVIDGWSHPMNIARFFDSGMDDAVKVLYDVRQDVNPNMIADNLEYEHQYDFSEYMAGARYLKCKDYSEKMSYFAPIYINGADIPEYFIILKIDGAINGNLSELLKNKETAYLPYEYMNELLSRSTIIKTFDMGISSRIGMYLRNMVNDPNFPESGLNVNFNEGMFTRWYGVSISGGAYSDAGELLHDFYSERKPLSVFEEYITDGYKRHGLLHPNIINLEFLFDDNTSEVFDHNRYLGFYVNQCDIAKFMSGARKQISIQDIVGNYPKIYSDIKQYKCLNAEINNDNGVCINAYESGITSTDVEKITRTNDNQVLPYIKDKAGNFHEIIDFKFDDGGNLDYVRIADKTVQYCDFVGSDDIQVINDYGTNDDNYSRSFVYIKFNNIPENGDSIKIFHNNGTFVDGNGLRYDKILFSRVNGDSDFYCGKYLSVINVTGEIIPSDIEYSYKGIYSSGRISELKKIGDYFELSEYSKFTSEIAEISQETDITGDETGNILLRTRNSNNKEIILFTSRDHINFENHNIYTVGVCGGVQHLDKFSEGLADCVNTIPQSPFYAYGCDGEFIIVYQSGGDYDGSFSVMPDIYDKTIYSITGNDKGDSVYYSIGGSNNKYNLLIDDIHENTVNTNLCVRMDTYHSRVEKIGRKTSGFVLGMDKDAVRNEFKNFNENIVLILSDDAPALLADGKFYITSLYEVPVGYFSFYRVKDFDFDHFSKRYSNTTYWDSYKYKVPNGVKYIDPYVIYEIPNGSFNVTCDGCTVETYQDNKYFSIIPKSGNYDEYYSYRSNVDYDTYVIPYLYVLDENGKRTYDFDKYIDTYAFSPENGSSVIYINDDDEKHLDDMSPLMNNVSCEYDYYSENYYIDDTTRDGALVPHSCKWAMKNGMDAFNNPYRLNASDVFGISNLSPNDSKFVDVDLYTNNWMYIVSNVYQSNDNYCYINKQFDIDSDDFSFDDYFTLYVDGTYRYLYSAVTYNKTTGKCETFFRGKKIIINQYNENGSVITGDPKYNGYKFSALLVPRRIDPKNRPVRPVDYVLTVDDEQKYILYYVNLYLDDNSVNKGVSDTLTVESLVGRKYKYMCNYSEFIGMEEQYIPQNNFIIFDKSYPSVKINSETYTNVDAGSVLLCIANYGDVYYDEDYYTDGSESGSETGSGSGGGSTAVIAQGSVYQLYGKDKLKTEEFFCHISTLYSSEDPLCVDADYRISFDERGICSLTYSDLYEFKSKKFGKFSNQYATIQLPFAIKLNSQSDKLSVKSHPDHYDVNLASSVNTFDNNCPFVVEYSTPTGVKYDTIMTYFIDSDDLYPMPVSVANGADQHYLYTNYSKSGYNIGVCRFKLVDGEYKESMYNYQDYLYQVCGGVDYFSENLFKSINFNSILNTFDSNNGLLIYDTNDRISLSEDIPSIIETSKYIGVESVYDVESNTVIGNTYNITDRRTPSSFDNEKFLYRYSGNYDPVFVDVMKFGSNGNDYNVFFNSKSGDFGVLRNFPHLKVSEGEIIDKNISVSSNLTGNNTVGYSDMDILRTSWDLDFHKKYTSSIDYEPVPGTLRIQEDDTYVNNIIILPDSIKLTKFTSELVDDVYSVNMIDKELVYSVSGNDVYVRVNYKQVVIDKLVEMGISKAFDQINTSSNIKLLGMDIDSYIAKYIEENILKMYGVDNLYLYYTVRNKEGFSISSTDFNKEDSGNFAMDKNVRIKDCGDNIIEFVYHISGKYSPVLNFVMDMKLI